MPCSEVRSVILRVFLFHADGNVDVACYPTGGACLLIVDGWV